MIFVNYKTYESGTGERAVLLSKMIEEISKATGIKIIPVVQATDIQEISSSVSIEVWAQKIDPLEFGAHTGGILPEAIFDDGASGTFLNHSENRFLNFEDLTKANTRAKEIGLKTLIFAKDIDELSKVSSLNPNYISYEPPELIGRSDISVATAKPEVISLASNISKQSGIPLIVGAGVHSWQDVKKCLELGATGIAVASDVMNSDDPRKELLDLTEGFS